MHHITLRDINAVEIVIGIDLGNVTIRTVRNAMIVVLMTETDVDFVQEIRAVSFALVETHRAMAEIGRAFRAHAFFPGIVCNEN